MIKFSVDKTTLINTLIQSREYKRINNQELKNLLSTLILSDLMNTTKLLPDTLETDTYLETLNKLMDLHYQYEQQFDETTREMKDYTWRLVVIFEENIKIDD